MLKPLVKSGIAMIGNLPLSVFDTLDLLWGPSSLNCFACYYNAKTPCFLSCFWNPVQLALTPVAADSLFPLD